MRIFILSDIGSIHTKRWVAALSQKGIDIFLWGLNFKDKDTEYYAQFPNVALSKTNYTDSIKNIIKDGTFEKLRYLKAIKLLKQCIADFQPDILHAHYASSYGLLGALTGFHPYIISAWGSDVYDFPNVSFLHKQALKYSLSKADKILSTSHVMAKETQKYTGKAIEITPFGVDLSLFKKTDIPRQSEGTFVVGNVKTLAPKYGIDVLINAFKLLMDNNPNKRLRLEIVGEGPDREKLQQLTQELGISQHIIFKGKIENHLLPLVYNSVSVSVSVSYSESFGVVAVEAMSCECPVVVSDADGFTEVVVDGETGFIVPKRDAAATATAIQKFIDDPSLRAKMGNNGRQRVEHLYNWKNNVDVMVNIYNEMINK
ncbi:MAG: glycosyltransferase [Prevotellaceae bacterium]|jgi:glycosyltransferase involved in cell wall biosynthesis|nr:glycosyltransferase [Prevotellaceae bacterium]